MRIHPKSDIPSQSTAARNWENAYDEQHVRDELQGIQPSWRSNSEVTQSLPQRWQTFEPCGFTGKMYVGQSTHLSRYHHISIPGKARLLAVAFGASTGSRLPPSTPSPSGCLEIV
jgi:hypothetical protein